MKRAKEVKMEKAWEFMQYGDDDDEEFDDSEYWLIFFVFIPYLDLVQMNTLFWHCQNVRIWALLK